MEAIMDMSECPRILREFLTYHETIKGQSKRTITAWSILFSIAVFRWLFR